MVKIHPKVFEYLLKSYFYVGNSSYKYLLEILDFLSLSKKFNLEEYKEDERKDFDEKTKESPESIHELESIIWNLEDRQGKVYEFLFRYLKSLTEDDVYQLLMSLLPDTNFNRMAQDNWNYYGDYVKDWHGNLIYYLGLCGIKYDLGKKQLVSSKGDLNIKNIISKSDLIDIKFEDIFYKNLNQEINRCYKIGAYTASFILSRKLIENLIIDILRKKYPKNEENLKIYCRVENKKAKRFHDLAILLENLKKKKIEFGIDEEIIDEFFKFIKPFRPKANSSAHSIIIWGSKEDLDKLQIEKMIGLLIKVYKSLV